MKIRFHKNFEKKYRKLKKMQKQRVRKQLALFLKDEFDPILNNHPLKGKHGGYRSINITGDIRAIYKHHSNKERIFVAIDTHSNLYK